MCPHCEGLAPAFREGRTCVLFKGPARALVHELKYHRGLFALEDIEEAKLEALKQASSHGWSDVSAGRYVDVADDHLEDFIGHLGRTAGAPRA